MTQNKFKKISLLLIVAVLLLAIVFGAFSSIFEITIYAANENDDKHKYELYGVEVNKNTLIMHSKLDAIYGRLAAWEDKQAELEAAAEKKYEGIFKEKRTKAEKELRGKRIADALGKFNKQLPGFVKIYKDAMDGGDFDKANLYDSIFSVASSIATFCGPYGPAISAVIDVGDTVFNLVMGEIAQLLKLFKLKTG